MQLRKSELVPHWFYFFNYFFIYYVLLCWVFLAVYALLSCRDRGPRCGTQASPPAVASPVAEHGLWGMRPSGTLANGLSCLMHMESSQTRDRTHISCISRQIL